MNRDGLFEVYQVKSTRQENPRTHTLTFDAPLPSDPGQYVMAWLPGIGEKPFSISANDPLALT
ncbi:MAG TPA: hypothetical protein PKL82_06770, partial [Anaerolineaceae bacterium]|nr:hypothetical protein [Anaerolineaceae bacterium]